MVKVYKKISLCIICMNRLFQLQETLVENILSNINYPNIEVLILDYNSQDGMELWIKENLISYIKLGKVIYYRTNQPKSFNHSHAKNLAFKLASGDIVCNINADHFTGDNFADYVNNQFACDANIVITPISLRLSGGFSPPRDVCGKVCVKKADFLKVSGFDERMLTYGFEDYDFINRLELINVKRSILNEPEFLKFLHHSDSERFVLDDNYKTLDKILIQYISPSTSCAIFMYKNGDFEMGKIIDNASLNYEDFNKCFNERLHEFEFSVEGFAWIRGTWRPDKKKLIFKTIDGGNFFLETLGDYYSGNFNNSYCKFYPLEEKESRHGLLDFHYFFKNRSLLEQNLFNMNFRPNLENFGEAIVSKNFDTKNPIYI